MDLIQHFGVDLEDPALDERSWPWLQALILGLFDLDSRLKQALTAPVSS